MSVRILQRSHPEVCLLERLSISRAGPADTSPARIPIAGQSQEGE
jgi:hypothetical protein